MKTTSAIARKCFQWRLVEAPGFAEDAAERIHARELTRMVGRTACLGGGRPVAVQRAVAAVERDQLLVRALLDDLTVLEDDDQVGAPDRRETMGDDERRPPGQQAAQAELDPPLGADVDARRRLVQDEDARVGQERPREGDELPLSE